MSDRPAIEAALQQQGFDDFRWILAADVTVAQWVRLKCQFGCPLYGRNASCPPATPTVDECQRLVAEYDEALIIHVTGHHDDPSDRKTWTADLNGRLVAAERAAFLCGHHKAFMFFLDDCSFCTQCTPHRTECRRPKEARPSCEAMAIDVFATARRAGFQIQVLDRLGLEMNRYAILLVE